MTENLSIKQASDLLKSKHLSSKELIEIADLVTEMTQVKHPFRSGVKAQKGIEF